MNSKLAIQTNNLHKSFGNVQAVQNINLEIQKGEIFSLLGPNGAGKSTTISILAGLLRPDQGDATIMGHSITHEPMQAKAAIGLVPQDIALYGDLSARENLLFWGKMFGLRGKDLKVRTDEILEVVGLVDRQKDKISTYSGGMKRRINIGVALLHNPDVVIMDEPTVGIDPQSRRNILDNVKNLNANGMTVLYTTHYMEEAQELSNHIAIMDHGKMIAVGTHTELVNIAGEMESIEITVNQNGSKIIEIWRNLPGVSSANSENGMITLIVKDSNKILPGIFESANKANTRITSVEIFEPNLEAVFLHLTGRALRD
ncbi:MAG: ABC transporter ATP-binding protein [Anaerolineaceae bacterium]|nr:ABC transporter ATP-binding protein [Anaerolineaceae bacterium]